MNDTIKFLNTKILTATKTLSYTIKDLAPSTEVELFRSTGLVVWSGASDRTIFQDEAVNWAFRAFHDAFHLKSGLGFSPDEEIEIGKRQAARVASQCDALLAELIYCEVAGQASYFKTHGRFVTNQIKFTQDYFLKLNIKI